jgi:two-component system, OmpR family, response regulator ArlR
MKILMVEDEKRLAEAIAQILKENNYLVDLARDGEYGLDCAITGIYDIIILDIMLPKKDGISVLREIRRKKIETPVIMLTAKGETADIVNGLDSGADDYLVKPFPTEELLARLRALGRRKGELMQDGIVQAYDVELNPNTLYMSSQSDSVKLSAREFQLMEFLMKRNDMVTSKNMIIEKIWGFDTEADEHIVEVYISFLRKKLSCIEAGVEIKTERGLG